tara:strand:- start:720 stop:914 length:195 start_codon:yes stop_codon:yes gene_type:complete
MAINTEQELVNKVFPSDNTKTISDVITLLRESFIEAGRTGFSDDDVISELKAHTSHSNITDWSI